MNDFNSNYEFANNNNTYDGIIERILHEGTDRMSESDLLTLLLAGRNNESSKKLVKRLLEKYRNGTSGLCRAEKEDVLEVEGMDTETLAKIYAIGALASIIGTSVALRTPNMSGSFSVKELLLPKLRYKKHIEYYAVFMNRKYNLIKYVKISEGGYKEATIDKQHILREALLCKAHAVSIIHNQPDGIVEPSDDDVKQTLALQSACEAIGLDLYDHVITDDGFAIYSYRREGKL